MCEITEGSPIIENTVNVRKWFQSERTLQGAFKIYHQQHVYELAYARLLSAQHCSNS